MGQETLTLPKETINEMKEYYKNQLDTPPQWAAFRARTKYATITAYHSGKVLFQGESPELETKKWEGKGTTSQQKKNSKTNSHNHRPPEILFSKNHIGSDESGTGDYFGPITTCAVFVKAEQIPLLKEIGIQDSKAITDTRIKELSKILADMNIPYSLMILHNQKYNQLQNQGWTQGKMKAMLHASCITNLQNKIQDQTNEGIIIDQFCLPDVYKKHLATEGKTTDKNTFFMTKAENYSIAVAAGSIIARASFINELDKLSEIAGTSLLKGASNKVDKQIAHIIKQKGKEVLPLIAKVHFANTKKAQHYV